MFPAVCLYVIRTGMCTRSAPLSLSSLAVSVRLRLGEAHTELSVPWVRSNSQLPKQCPPGNSWSTTGSRKPADVAWPTLGGSRSKRCGSCCMPAWRGHMLGVSTDTEHLWEKTHLLQVLCAVSVAGVLSREPVLEEDQLLIHAFALINTASL